MTKQISTIEAQAEQIKQLEKQNRNLKEAWDEQKEEIRSLHAGYKSANDHSDEELYFWEPYAENHLETLTGGVVIRAEWLRQLIAEAVQEQAKELEQTREARDKALSQMANFEEMYEDERKELERMKEEVKTLQSVDKETFHNLMEKTDALTDSLKELELKKSTIQNYEHTRKLHQVENEQLRNMNLANALELSEARNQLKEAVSLIDELDGYVDLSQPLEPGEWGFKNPSGINETLEKLHDFMISHIQGKENQDDT